MWIIDYFQSENQAHWLGRIAACEWGAACFLAELLTKGSFHQAVGQGTLFLLIDDDQLVSFLTLSERDCVDAPDLAPWIGFVHTAPNTVGIATSASCSTMPALLPASTVRRGFTSAPTMWACTRSMASPTWKTG